MQQIPYFKLSLAGKELDLVSDVIQSGWLTTGKYVLQLEQLMQQLTGAKHALAVNSCTSALHLALDAVGVTRGDTVLVPSLTFTASAEVIRYLDATPVLMDCDYDSRLVTPEILEASLQQYPHAKAVILVHYAGHSLDMDAIIPLCRQYDVKVVEDAAHALPCRYGDNIVGNMGDITCFSFYANKTMTTGEGGMVTTNDDTYARRMSVMRLHGIDRDVWDRFTSDKPKWEYDVIAPGYKYNMPDINAAVGVAQFENLHTMRVGRQRVAQRYFDNLSACDVLDVPKISVPMSYHAWHIFAVVVQSYTITRAQVIERLQSRGIGTGVHYKPLHQLHYYKHMYRLQACDFPHTEKYWQGCISLPIYDALTDAQVDYICDTIKDILAV